MSAVIQRLCYIWQHPANRRRRLARLARAFHWQVDKRLRGASWDVSIPGGARIRCHPDSQSATLLLYCGGLCDYHEMRFVRDYLRPGDHFLDIGANVGIYSLLAATTIGAEGRVDAFEPVPATVERLRENLRLNHVETVHIHPLAVSDQAGTVQFDVGHDAMNHIVARSENTPPTQCLDIECVVLDKYLDGRRYALGKIDIEGAEPLALRGAQGMLRQANPPVWLLEINGLLRRFGFQEEQFERFLAEQGFDLAWYDSDRRQLVFQEELWRQHDNLLAVARGARSEVQRRIAE